jgi:hypothetical protein
VRKSRVTRIPQNAPLSDQAWIDVPRIASVEVSSEETDYPIEMALLLEEKKGWRAATPGTQTIRLIFDEAQKLKRIFLVFEDTENIRTQEFIVRWSPDIDGPFQEIIRQQWNFSSPDSVRETEDYRVELSVVKVLELMIVPYKSGREVHASLMSLRLA